MNFIFDNKKILFEKAVSFVLAAFCLFYRQEGYKMGSPFKSQKYGSNVIGKNQTFSIGIRDALIQVLANAELNERIMRGEYLYVDSHFVFNSAKYVEADGDGIRLTDYARFHMEECCLSFGIPLRREYGGLRNDSICKFRLEYKSPFEYDIRFSEGYENLSPEVHGDRERTVYRL